MKKIISILDNKAIVPLIANPFESLSYKNQNSIEEGYFIFTLMPSLRCSLNCPHCYLSLEQRRNSEILSLDNLKIICQKVDSYYKSKKIENKTIVNYWYGGEPTEMGFDYFTQAVEIINAAFNPNEGYQTKHIVLTSLMDIDEKWFEFFHQYGEGYFQSSYDGGMRGNIYTKKWEKKAISAIKNGLSLATISVVNRAIILDTPEKTLDYLSDLGIVETGWLPFMWNEQNDGDPYKTFAPSMNEYSDFMIALTKHYFKRKSEGKFASEIGTLRFILAQSNRDELSNIASQTLFLLPNGDFVLPDYKNGYQEYMRKFGNILNSSFEEVLGSSERRAYLRKQVLRNKNAECIECPHANKCVMEFWKENRAGDDCFGAKKYVEWVLSLPEKDKQSFSSPVLY